MERKREKELKAVFAKISSQRKNERERDGELILGSLIWVLLGESARVLGPDVHYCC